DMLSIYTPADKKLIAGPTAITGISLMDQEQHFSRHDQLGAEDTIWSPARDTFYLRSNFRADTGYLKRAAVSWTGLEGPYGIPVGLKLPYHQDHVTFHFTGNYLSNTDKTLYRYVLEGNDVQWNAEVSTAYADYRNLSPGMYTFRVSSKNFDGPWSEPAVFSFEVTPPWWKTTAAYGFYVLCFAGSVFGYNRLRTKQLLSRQKELEQNVKERTAEIVQQKNEIESQKLLVEEKQKEIVDSINYAQRIQFTLLAHEKVLKKHFSDHFVLFQPKDIVSGDFYWATKQDNRFYLAVCDSTGHGVPGAFMSLLNISFLNEAIIEKEIKEPNLVLDYVRDRLIRSISHEGRQDGMDGILICIEENETGEKMKITYAAANNNPMLYSNSRLSELPYSKMPIGKGERMAPFALFEIKAAKSDMLYLYTDGFADQFGGPSGKKFKYKQLNELLQANANANLTVQHDALLKALTSWKAGLEQVDDICVLGLRL
ncbi:MAG: SpoIIE family protein phosphatase, partial [Bacteroidia bacterium]